MDPTRRDALTACLTAVFGDGHDDLIAEALPLLEWVELNGGRSLVREGDPADAVYFVVSGRLRAHATLAGERVMVDEVDRGGTVGEAAVLAPRYGRRRGRVRGISPQSGSGAPSSGNVSPWSG